MINFSDKVVPMRTIKLTVLVLIVRSSMLMAMNHEGKECDKEFFFDSSFVAQSSMLQGCLEAQALCDQRCAVSPCSMHVPIPSEYSNGARLLQEVWMARRSEHGSLGVVSAKFPEEQKELMHAAEYFGNEQILMQTASVYAQWLLKPATLDILIRDSKNLEGKVDLCPWAADCVKQIFLQNLGEFIQSFPYHGQLYANHAVYWQDEDQGNDSICGISVTRKAHVFSWSMCEQLNKILISFQTAAVDYNPNLQLLHPSGARTECSYFAITPDESSCIVVTKAPIQAMFIIPADQFFETQPVVPSHIIEAHPYVASFTHLTTDMLAQSITVNVDTSKIAWIEEKNRRLALYDCSTKKISYGPSHCRSICFSLDGTKLLVARDSGVIFFDVIAWRCERRLEFRAPVLMAQYSPDNKKFMVVMPRCVKIYETDNVDISYLELYVYDDNFSCVSWNVDCNSVITGGTNGFLRIWDCNTGECSVEHQIKTLDEPAVILALDVSHDNHYAIITYRRKRTGYTAPFYELGIGIVNVQTGEFTQADNVIDETVYGRLVQAYTSGWQDFKMTELSLIQVLALASIRRAFVQRQMVALAVEHPYVKAIAELPGSLGLAAKKRTMIQVRP